MIALGIALYVTLAVAGLAFMIAAGIAGRRDRPAPHHDLRAPPAQEPAAGVLTPPAPAADVLRVPHTDGVI